MIDLLFLLFFNRFDLDVYHERDESAKVNGFSSDNFDDDHNHHDEDDIHTYYDSEDENDSDGDGENLDSSKQYEKLDCSSLKSLLEKHDYAGIKQSIFGTSRDNLVTSFNFILEHIDFLFKKPVISVRYFLYWVSSNNDRICCYEKVFDFRILGILSVN